MIEKIKRRKTGNSIFVLLLVIIAITVLSFPSYAQFFNSYEEDFNLIQPIESESLQYADEYIKISFNFNEELGVLKPTLESGVTSYKRIGIKLRNKTNNLVTVNWNRSSVILPSGTSSKVVHKGVRYVRAGEDISPTTIPPKAVIEDFVVPVDNIEYFTSDWHIWGLGLEKDATFGLYLTLKIGEKEQDYNFRFLVDELRKKQS